MERRKKVFRLLKCNKLFLLVVILSSPLFSFSQSKINGIITGTDKEMLPYANVVVYQADESTLITYAISDENGKYHLQLNNGTYLFKVSYLGYEPLTVEKEITKDETIHFNLVEGTTRLKDVVVKSKRLSSTIKNDTINYNISSLTTGNEENLKGVLNKLPGIEVDENGKIKAHGKKIDKLLIGGKDFFGDQHQLATENISSEMVKGVSLIKNFNDFSDLGNQEGSGKSAMNIEIGEDYKGSIKGNTTMGGGYKEKYDFNVNLFSFREKSNFYFIGNTNNVGKQTFTFEDYINFQGGIQKLLENSNSVNISGEDLPPYLLSTDEVESKNEQLSAFNYSYQPSTRFKLSSYLIFDRVAITEKQSADQTYIANNKTFTLNLNSSNKNGFLVNNSYVNAVYKPGRNSVFEYTLNFSPQSNDLRNNEIFGVSHFDTKRNKASYRLNQVFDYKQRIINKYTLKLSFYHSFKQLNEDLSILSDRSFLGLQFKNNDYSVLQNINTLNNNFGLNSSLSGMLTKRNYFKVTYRHSNSHETFQSNITNNALNNDVRLNIAENTVGLSLYNSRQKYFLHYKVGSDLSHINPNSNTNIYLLPFADIQFNFRKTHSLLLSYNRTLELPKPRNLIENSYISNFNTLINNENIFPNTISKYNNFRFNYLLNDLFSGTLLNFGGSLGISEDVIVTNTLLTENTLFTNYRVNNFLLGNNNRNINSYLLIDKKFGKVTFSIRSKSLFTITETNNFVNSKSNVISSTILSNSISLNSNFEKPLFNFELGYLRRLSFIESRGINTNNKVLLNSPFLNLFFDYEKISLTINNSAEFYNSTNLYQYFFNISPVLRYKQGNNKWSFFIEGNDLLNLNRNSIVENAVYENYFEVKNVSTIGGFIITGLSYKF